MEFDDLLKFADLELKRLKKSYPNLFDDEKFTLAVTVKLMEELGELSTDILAHHNLQRPEKLEKHDKGNMPGEFADVFLVTLILAKALNIDVKNAIKNKIDKINKKRIS